MIVKPTKDIDEIKRILCHPDIFRNICGDYDIKPEEFIPPMKDVVYLGGYDREIFAVSCFHPFKDGLKFHPNVLPKYRLQHAKDFVKQSITMVKCRLYIEIPKKRKRLFNLAHKLGFDSIVNNKDSTNHLMRLQ